METLPKSRWTAQDHFTVWKQQNDINTRLRNSVSVLAAAAFLAANGPHGMVLDFADASIAIKEASGVLDFTSQGQVSGGALVGPGAKLTYSAPSVKLTEQEDGFLKFQAHNLILRSESLDNASWTALQGVVTAVSYSGMFRVNCGSTANATGLYQTFTYVNGASYALSAEFKAGTYPYVTLDFANLGNLGATFDLSDGTVGFSNAGITATIVSLGSGVYRCTIQSSSLALSVSYPEFYASNSRTANGRNWTPTGTETFFANRVHLRRTPSVDTYIATTSAAAYDLPYVYSGGVRQGIAVEPAATNLVVNTAFGGAVSGTPGTAPTSWTAPAAGGSLTVTGGSIISGGTRLEISATVARHFISQNISLTSGVTYSVRGFVEVVSGSLAVAQVMFYSTAVVGSVDTWYVDGVLGNSATVLGVGRHTIDLKVVAGGTGVFAFRAGVGVLSNSTGTVRLDHLQFETGTVATSPIITYGAAVARAIDLMYVPASLFPYSATAAFLFAKMVRGSSTPNSRVGVSLNLNGTGGPAGDNISAAYWSNTTAAASWYAGERTKTFSTTPVAGDTVKIASCFATSGTLASVSTQGQAVATSPSSAWDGGSNRLYVGVMDATGLWAANDCLIKQIAYFPEYDTAKAEAITT